MDILQIIFSIIGWGSILFSVYGLSKMNRVNFLLGSFIFSLLPIIGELNVFSQTNNWGDIATVAAFLGIAINVFPSKITYNAENISATNLAMKIGISVVIVNLIQAFIILKLRDDVPFQYAMMHISEAIIFVLMISKISKNKS